MSSSGTRPVYNDSYDKKLAESYDRIKNREAFRYNASADPLYKKYKNDYITQGRAAMRDTMGQTASLTGGYSSSYSQSAGQHSYNSHLERLGNIIPQLYELAYSRYENEGQSMWDSFNALKSLRDSEYKRYSDELNDYENEQEREYQHRTDAEKQEYQRRTDAEKQEYQRRTDAEKQEYQRRTDAEKQEYQRAQDEARRRESEAAAKAKYGDFSGYADLYGIQTADSMRNYWISANPQTAYNMGLIDASRYFAMTGEYAPGFEPQPIVAAAYSGNYYPSTAPDGRDARTVQRELRSMGYDIAVDGAWGPKSQAAWDNAHGRTSWL